ncbi:MAG: hypothetical protein ACPIOQ_70360, partial [Promethearchaeia archaeon]
MGNTLALSWHADRTALARTVLPPRGQARARECLETTGTMCSGRGAHGVRRRRSKTGVTWSECRRAAARWAWSISCRRAWALAPPPCPILGRLCGPRVCPAGSAGEPAALSAAGEKEGGGLQDRGGVLFVCCLCGKEIVTRRGRGRLSRQEPQTTDRHTAAMRL